MLLYSPGPLSMNIAKSYRNRIMNYMKSCCAILPSRRAFTSNQPSSFLSSQSTSVSSEEVTKFSLMSPTWWDYSQNPLLSMNPTRVKKIVQVIRSRNNALQLLPRSSHPLSGMTALDVGCGGGVLSESLARLGASVTAIDPSTQIVNAAKEHSKLDSRTRTIDYRGGISVEDLALSFKDNKFDIICILEVIEHAKDPLGLIQHASQLLKRPTPDNPVGGTLFISTLNRTLKSYMLGILGAEHILRMLPVGTHDWNNFKSPEEVERMIQTVQIEDGEKDSIGKLVQLEVSGMVFSPDIFTKSFSFNCNQDSQSLAMNWIGAYAFQKV